MKKSHLLPTYLTMKNLSIVLLVSILHITAVFIDETKNNHILDGVSHGDNFLFYGNGNHTLKVIIHHGRFYFYDNGNHSDCTTHPTTNHDKLYIYGNGKQSHLTTHPTTNHKFYI